VRPREIIDVSFAGAQAGFFFNFIIGINNGEKYPVLYRVSLPMSYAESFT